MEHADSASITVRPAGVKPPAEVLWTVQVMRGAAALMVVAGHTQSAVTAMMREAGGSFARSALVPWGASVDLFFVISGFIIVHASVRLCGRPGARGEFVRRRLARIVPLYWLVTTAFLLLLAAASLKGGDAFPPPGAILASYAFLPADTHGTGTLFPVYDLGWTLNYEMFFYALLTLVIAWPPRRALAGLGVAIGALVVAGEIVPGPSALWFWTRPIIVDFGLGVAVGASTLGGVRLGRRARIALALAAVAVLLADPGHVFDGPAGMTVANQWPRVLLAGVPMAALLAAAVLGAQPPMPRAALPLTLLGDASYSLYLLHPFALIVMEKLQQKLHIAAWLPGWAIVLATVAVAIALAFAGYRWIERPMTAAIGRRLRRPPPCPAPIVAEQEKSC